MLLSMGFKENLKSELEYRGMLVKELAEESGIKKQTLDNYLSTHNSIPNAEIALKIAHALGTSVERLFSDGTESSDSDSSMSADIAELVRRYRRLPAEKQRVVLSLLRVM